MKTSLLVALLLAGCSTVPQPSVPTTSQGGIACSLVSTFTTTVVTVLVSQIQGNVKIGPDCSVTIKQDAQ